MIKTKRVYEPPVPSDGARYLVDRLWPRGLKKEELALDDWLKELAPSDELRKWFAHDPRRWPEFCERYFKELETKAELWQPLLEKARVGNLTLIFSARDVEHNNAVALKMFLERKLASKGSEINEE